MTVGTSWLPVTAPLVSATGPRLEREVQRIRILSRLSEAARLPDNAIHITNTFGSLSNTDGLFLDNETRTQSNGVRI